MWQDEIPNLQCENSICKIQSDCSDLASKLEHFKMDLDEEYYFLIPPAEFLINGTHFGEADYCYLGVKGGGDEEAPYIFGKVFLQNFYLIFDNDS